MKETEWQNFLLNKPLSEKEREYCVCRNIYNKRDFPMVACNVCEE